MPVSIYWDNDEKTILVEKFDGHWTIEEYYRLVDTDAEWLGQVPHMVHVIYDATTSSMPPRQIFSGIQYALKKLPPNQGLTVFVKLNRVMTMFVDVASQISPRFARTHYYAETIEEARRIIAYKSGELKVGH